MEAWWLPVGQPCYHLSSRLCSQQDGSSITVNNPCEEGAGGLMARREESKDTVWAEIADKQISPQIILKFDHLHALKLRKRA